MLCCNEILQDLKDIGLTGRRSAFIKNYATLYIPSTWRNNF